jgi:preprotein translocase subunit SecG
MNTLLIIVHVLVCLFLVGIVLLQHGKGADIGASFGGSSQSLFGTEGPLPLLNKITTAVAVIFMVTSVALAYISAHKSTGSVMESISKEQAATSVETEQKTTEMAVPAEEEKIQIQDKPEDSKTQ